ncbi:MAG: hypothetical protein JKY56_06360 [Kofleriaceae bacterium]|nr:hypothetical protein [Kofleriaceae bacterium]
MPNGQYAGSWESGTGMLELKDDQSFFLRYKNRYTGSETQWNGRFEWKKQGIGEVLNLCDIRKATNARMQEGTASQSTAVFGINHERHRFEVSLSGVGKMVFNKKES